MLNKLEKNKNPGKNLFTLNNTHYNDINRYKIYLLTARQLKGTDC